MKHILLIDDDAIIHHLVQISLKDEYQVDVAFDLKSAYALIDGETRYDLVILDRSLPDGDGLSLCSYIRQQDFGQNLPVIFLSASDKEADKVTGLFAGADDYITKPFSALELKARIKARLREFKKTLQFGPLSFDIDASRVFFGSGSFRKEIELTRYEYKILIMLAQSPDRVFTRQNILDRVWGSDLHVNDRVVDAHISHLRKKIELCHVKVEALRGEGYRLVQTPAPIKQSAAA